MVNADSNAVMGMSYLGEVRWSDLPSSLVNAEVIVEIMYGTGTSGKVIHLVLTSGNRNPYRWEYTYWNNGSNSSGWIGFQPEITNTNQLSSDLVTDTNHNHKFVTGQMYEYLDNLLYQAPNIDTLTLYNNDSAVATTNESGTTVIISQIRHKETNINNISGDLKFNGEDITPQSIIGTTTLTTPITTTITQTFTLSGTNTKNQSFSRSVTITFNQYAYTKVSDSTTTPTTSLTKQSTLSTFASSGASITYNAGDYIYFYTKTDNQKVQVNVLGQWADVTTENLGSQQITLNNGTQANYYVYRVGPFSSGGTDTYRVVNQ